MILQSGLPVVASLALLFAAIVLGHRHHRRETNRLGVERHLRSVGPMPEHWVDRWEREGRT